MSLEDPQGPPRSPSHLDALAIVMGQRGMSGVKSAFLGSVSRQVVNAYHRPVIVV
jgi:nucleotide-binding universal stress UspA family protein